MKIRLYLPRGVKIFPGKTSKWYDIRKCHNLTRRGETSSNRRKRYWSKQCSKKYLACLSCCLLIEIAWNFYMLCLSYCCLSSFLLPNRHYYKELWRLEWREENTCQYLWRKVFENVCSCFDEIWQFKSQNILQTTTYYKWSRSTYQTCQFFKLYKLLKTLQPSTTLLGFIYQFTI